jgi:putative flippase GtrA
MLDCRVASPTHNMSPRLLAQFARFAVVGVIGFVVDAGTLYAAMAALSLNLYAGRVVSFLAAASVTWVLNRAWTFRDAPRKPSHRQWLQFVSVNSVGGLVNYGVYAVLVATVALAHRWPVIAVAAGSVSGLSFNFVLSRSLVFREARR